VAGFSRRGLVAVGIAALMLLTVLHHGPAASAQTPAPTTDQLKAAILTPEELGPGFRVTREGPFTSGTGYSRTMLRSDANVESVLVQLVVSPLFTPSLALDAAVQGIEQSVMRDVRISSRFTPAGFGPDAQAAAVTGTIAGAPTVGGIIAWREGNVVASMGMFVASVLAPLPTSEEFARSVAPPPPPAVAVVSQRQATETVSLFAGCNNVSLTWPSGTPAAVVAQAFTPTDALSAMWRYDNRQGQFAGFSPSFPAVSDLTSVNLLDAVFLCVTADAALTRPVPGGAGSAAAPSPTPPAAPAPAPVAASSFGSGTQVVGTDIQPGTYRARDARGSCYWERLSGFGGTLDEIIANDNPPGPAVVTIAPTDAGFNSTRCGAWTSDLSPITSSPTAPFGDGTYIVGTDIAPGRWRAEGGSGCYWERLSGFGGTLDEIIANDFGSATPVVEIRATDKGFTTSDCGTWTRIG
jgi:hypothetical protein